MASVASILAFVAIMGTGIVLYTAAGAFVRRGWPFEPPPYPGGERGLVRDLLLHRCAELVKYTPLILIFLFVPDESVDEGPVRLLLIGFIVAFALTADRLWKHVAPLSVMHRAQRIAAWRRAREKQLNGNAAGFRAMAKRRTQWRSLSG